MRLGIGFSLVIDGGYRFVANGGSFVSDEMKDIAREYKDKLEQKKLNKTVFVEEQRLLSTLGPKRWAELRQLIKERLDGFNAEMGYEAISWDDPHSDRISMTRKDDGIKLEGGYDEPIKTAFFRSKALEVDVVLTQVVQGNDVVFVNTKVSPFVIAPQEIAYNLIRDFLSR